MKPVITLSNHKGGVGKTTTAAALIDGFRRRGTRVLGIDCDPQANLSRIQGYAIAPGSASTLNFVKGAEPVVKDGQATLLADPELNEANPNADGHAGSEHLQAAQLGRRIHETMEAYDFDVCVIDTHPDTGFWTTAAIEASTHVIIPTEAELFSIDGIAQELAFIQDVTEEEQDEHEIQVACAITKYRSNTVVHRSIAEQLEQTCEDMGVKLLSQRISNRMQIPLAQANGISIYDVADVFTGAIAQYDWLCEEVANWVMGGEN